MNKLSYLLKTSRFLYAVYFYLMSGLIRFLGLFVRIDDKLILFNCYGGKKYDDSPKAIYEEMLRDERFAGYKFCWALQSPSSYSIPGPALVVRSDSFKYFLMTQKARVWVTNSSIERGLDIKKKKTFCLNTWHGTAIKVMGSDIKSDNKSFKSKVLVRADVMCAQGQYDVDTFSRCFCLPASSLRITGLPRNDVLASCSSISSIRSSLGIPSDKTVLLYAPTFREYTKGDSNEIVLDIPMTLSKWQTSLGDRFVVLFRAHYEVARHMNISGYPMFIDVSSYPDLNELMLVSDALISDYSSIYFDYSVMHKPMYCFAYDYDDYMKNRGMYLDLKSELPCEIHFSESSLIDSLMCFSSERSALSARCAEFQSKYVTEYGHGAAKCCDILMDEVLS